ncbi:MAG: hypothetical protein Q8R82_17825 [Hyphomonadaceae bacterium]|nr:hypothetical protein [Hyphomonadaceae bacterium]
MKQMRVVVSAVFVTALGAGGVATAQLPTQMQGQPVVSRASYTVEPYAPPGAPITIQGTGVRLRAEPFSTPQTQVLSSGSTGLALNVVGIARLPDWNWYQVVLKNGQKAFIRSDLTSSPSRGNGQAAPVAPVAVAPVPAPSAYAPTPPPTPQPYVPPPAYSQPIPAPQPVPLAPATTPAQTPPVTNSLPSLDLPKPSDPAGLRSN